MELGILVLLLVLAVLCSGFALLSLFAHLVIWFLKQAGWFTEEHPRSMARRTVKRNIFWNTR